MDIKCNKCGSSNIVIKRIIVEVEDLNKTEGSTKTSQRDMYFRCKECGNKVYSIYDIVDENNPITSKYWINKIDELHKKYHKLFQKSCKTNEALFNLYYEKEIELMKLELEAFNSIIQEDIGYFLAVYLKASYNINRRLNMYKCRIENIVLKQYTVTRKTSEYYRDIINKIRSKNWW